MSHIRFSLLNLLYIFIEQIAYMLNTDIYAYPYVYACMCIYTYIYFSSGFIYIYINIHIYIYNRFYDTTVCQSHK